MKRLFEISSEEKQRILEMHVSATKKNYLSEQTAQQKVPLPGQDILKQIGTSFNINDVLSKWTTQNQGYNGGYYWFSKHKDNNTGELHTNSVLALYTLLPNGDLYQFFALSYNIDKKIWSITKMAPTDSNHQNFAVDVLRTVTLDNLTDVYSAVIGQANININVDLYYNYVKNYVTIKPDTSIARSFKLPKEKLTPSNDTKQAQVDAIKKSPLYLALNTSAAAPTTPTTPTTR